MDPTWIPALRLVSEIREYCAHVCVYVFDSWTRFLPRLERDRSLWKLCDLALVSFESSRAAYARTLPCEVAYLPQGVDSSKFHPDRLDRPIDLLSIGRRHSVAHGLLLELARRHDLFYFFSESKAPQAIDVRQSQELLGRICQAARTQISWAVELTDPSRAGTDAPVTVRWFEAAACASVVLGSQPTAPEFERLFPLPTFVKELPLDDPKQFEKTVLASLGDARSPDRLALAAQTRRHHSWDARTQDVLRYFNLEATS
jgi:hypothetical protein